MVHDNDNIEYFFALEPTSDWNELEILADTQTETPTEKKKDYSEDELSLEEAVALLN
ncbi:hypothetical protein MITS9509_00428 [Synechococcus sp. MIT S9509]|uniref:hypothetical protein n=1 Tax=Synechococcus sp. MIT S9509 TaxID=1801630 RepID=UPI0007BBB18B|nr:hypothetical protein [Synechococcus sp. MIT S9509]KZR93135.1 hypothetical protein MITS9509_00428 [Synechococcus sp. MIT S9509]